MKKLFCVLLTIALLLSAFCLGSSAEGRTFDDVPEDAWYARFVADCVEKELMAGTSETTFSPDVKMTRAMFIQVLYRYYRKYVKGTDNEFWDHGSGDVATQTDIDVTYPFTLEQVSTIWTDPDDPSTATEKTYRVTRDQLLSGSFDEGFYATDITKKENNSIISFYSDHVLTLIPDSSADPCRIAMIGGFCVASGFEGKAERVTVHTDGAKVEAKTAVGEQFMITLGDVNSSTLVMVKGESSGEISAALNGFDLIVKGAKGEYTVRVFDWSWKFNSGALKTYVCSADTEKSNALPFGDVKDNAYYIEALKWAKIRKFTAGVSKTAFDPNACVTREQMATFLFKFLVKYKLSCVNYDAEYSFADIDEVSSYAKRAVEYVGRAGIMVGDKNGRFNPKAYAKRCEVATVFSNLENVIDG
ncbi:MAG: S-layer homology domain-containing protein [Clostridia bacterium]|nr:S-layer homology domain-containing protein [Clostridia bacterium]